MGCHHTLPSPTLKVPLAAAAVLATIVRAVVRSLLAEVVRAQQCFISAYNNHSDTVLTLPVTPGDPHEGEGA